MNIQSSWLAISWPWRKLCHRFCFRRPWLRKLTPSSADLFLVCSQTLVCFAINEACSHVSHSGVSAAQAVLGLFCLSAARLLAFSLWVLPLVVLIKLQARLAINYRKTQCSWRQRYISRFYLLIKKVLLLPKKPILIYWILGWVSRTTNWGGGERVVLKRQ